jgi:hypothetical protein
MTRGLIDRRVQLALFAPINWACFFLLSTVIMHWQYIKPVSLYPTTSTAAGPKMAHVNTNVDFSETRAADLHAVGWVFTGIAIVAGVLKLFARMETARRVGWDDFFIFFSVVS